MAKRLTGLALALLLTGLIWLGYQELGLLRGTEFWPYRYLLLALAAFLLLSLVERATHRIFHKPEPEET
ncbi:MAG: hypothetical protein Kilf2KO_36040 [Rhodospirillales bacterium]